MASESTTQPEPEMFIADMTGTLLRVSPQPNSRFEFFAWFPYTIGAMNKLQEGSLLVAKNFASNDSEERLSIMEVTQVLPHHYALGLAGQEDFSKFPGFHDVAFSSAYNDWLQETPKDDTTKIICKATPLFLEIRKPSAIGGSGKKPDIFDESNIPMVGGKVWLLTPQWTEKVYNRDLEKAAGNEIINIGKLSNMNEVIIKALWETLIQTHFGIFAYTNAGKSNLLSTFLSTVFTKSNNVKAVIYDLMGEYGILLIDVLYNNKDAVIACCSERTMPSSVIAYWRNPNESNLDKAAEDITKTSILPKKLLGYRQQFKEPIKQILKSGKIKLITVGGSGMLGDLITAQRDERVDQVRGTDQVQFQQFIDGLIQDFAQIEYSDANFTNLENRIEQHLQGIGGTNDQHKTWKMQTILLQRNIQSSHRSFTMGGKIGKDFLITNDEIITKLNDLTQKSLIIIQGHDDVEVRLESETLGRGMMEFRRRNGNIEPAVSFIFDEADQFIPQDPKEDGMIESKQMAVQLARRGRKYGLGIGIATQRIVYLDTNVLGQPHTYFVSKLPRASDREKIKEAFGLSDEVLEETHRFKKGQWMIISHSATGIDGVPIPVMLDDANVRIQKFLKP